MATVPSKQRTRAIEYPTGDGKPMAETEIHLHDMIDTIQVLEDYYARQPRVYVCGNMLMFYEEGNPRKHIAPEVFVVHGIAKQPPRDNYLVWKEEKAPDFIVEITSKSTKAEDRKKKFEIYRTILRVTEYFQFDPTEDYLKPPLQGFRLDGDDYVSIVPVDGRLPSQVLGLHLERDGQQLRFFNPTTGKRLLTRLEAREAAERAAEEERDRAEQERARVEQERKRAEQERQRADAAETAQEDLATEVERLRREIAALRQKRK
jgi:Uma2 family endonuclease